MIRDFISLFYPQLCCACGNHLNKGENLICGFCHYHLPKTEFHMEKNNPLIRHFWGKVDIHSAAAYYFFRKGEKVQQLVHQLKYKGRKDIGERIGELYGHELMKSPDFNTVEVIIPVPLHPMRQRKRGYNQSEMFANGLAKSMNRISLPHALKRNVATSTQTKKNRFSRWENVNRIFAAEEVSQLVHLHVLLVDDVITTGSTLEACVQVLSGIEGIRISIASIAYAE